MAKIDKVFNQFLKPISKEIDRKTKNTNNNYKYSKKYNFNNHIKSMLFLQLSGGVSLRDFDAKYNKHLKLKDEFDIPTYSQLSRLNASKSVENFKDIFNYVLGVAQKEIKSNFNLKQFKDIKAIDSSIITIGEGLAPDLLFDNKSSAVRLSTLYSCGKELPDKINIVHAKIGERNCIEGYAYDSNVIYTFDKGYNKYSWYDEMNSNNIKFITRLPSNTLIEQYSCRYTGIDNLYDLTVTLGADYSKNKTKYKYREIESFDAVTGEEFRLLTNINDMSAQDILSLYKKRWEIELFFKWIKQHLTIKNWLGHSINAISIQIYSALIVYILLLILKNRLKITYSKYNILRKLKAYLLEKFAIKEILLL